MHYYEIRVQEKLDHHWVQWFDGMHMEYCPNGETLLSGNIRDQPALFRLLLQIHHLRMTLLSVYRRAPVLLDQSP